MANWLKLIRTAEQLRLGYNETNYTSFTTGSTGDLTIAPTGGDTSITGTLAVSSTLAATGVSSLNGGWTARKASDGAQGSTGNVSVTSTLADGPILSGNTDVNGNSTANFPATRLGFGGDGLLISTSPATAVGSARTWTERGRCTPGGIFAWGTTDTTGGVAKSILIGNVAAAPTVNPVGGGIMYSEAGALKWRGSAGTITTLAPA
jgi:hypothetical protein